MPHFEDAKNAAAELSTEKRIYLKNEKVEIFPIALMKWTQATIIDMDPEKNNGLDVYRVINEDGIEQFFDIDHIRPLEAKNLGPVKACIDCKHRQDHPTLQLKSYSICMRPGLPQRIDMITGEQALDDCSNQRTDAAGKCGPEAKYFEPIVDTFDELTTFREKSVDWWTARQHFSRYMYHESKERGYDSSAASAAQAEYSKARTHFEKKYSEEFQFDHRPIDVSEKCPESVDIRIGA